MDCCKVLKDCCEPIEDIETGEMGALCDRACLEQTWDCIAELRLDMKNFQADAKSQVQLCSMDLAECREDASRNKWYWGGGGALLGILLTILLL